MWTKTFLTILLLHGSIAVAVTWTKSCHNCHGRDLSSQPSSLEPTHESPECVRCHISRIRPTSERSYTGLYANAPQFNSQKMDHLKPFDPDGLEAYLKIPHHRRRKIGGMYAMDHDMSRKATEVFKSWTQATDFDPRLDLVPHGKLLFMSKGCVQCHGSEGSAPLLPLGHALYNFQYFSKVVKTGTTYYSSEIKNLMPRYQNLVQEDLQAIYSFISLESPPAKEDLDDLHSSLKKGPLLYKSVLQVFLSNGCIHCHGNDGSSSDAHKIFGGRPDLFQIKMLNKNAVAYQERTSHDHVNPENFELNIRSKNRLIQVLEERRKEWNNPPKDSSQRGMPLTLPPLKSSELYLVKQWVESGCPTDSTKLCNGEQ
jgi:mono/diheme cytochrome c family protein